MYSQWDSMSSKRSHDYPFQILTEKRPDVSYFRKIGTEVVSKPRPKQKTFGNKARRNIRISYELGNSTAYKVHTHDRRKVIFSRDNKVPKNYVKMRKTLLFIKKEH